jgi:hypothetical protein
VLSKAWVCGHLHDRIVGLNPTGSVDVSFVSVVLSGRGLCDGLVSRPEESY